MKDPNDNERTIDVWERCFPGSDTEEGRALRQALEAAETRTRTSQRTYDLDGLLKSLEARRPEMPPFQPDVNFLAADILKTMIRAGHMCVRWEDLVKSAFEVADAFDAERKRRC